MNELTFTQEDTPAVLLFSPKRFRSYFYRSVSCDRVSLCAETEQLFILMWLMNNIATTVLGLRDAV